jgi:hypothetical protein
MMDQNAAFGKSCKGYISLRPNTSVVMLRSATWLMPLHLSLFYNSVVHQDAERCRLEERLTIVFTAGYLCS